MREAIRSVFDRRNPGYPRVQGPTRTDIDALAPFSLWSPRTVSLFAQDRKEKWVLICATHVLQTARGTAPASHRKLYPASAAFTKRSPSRASAPSVRRNSSAVLPRPSDAASRSSASQSASAPSKRRRQRDPTSGALPSSRRAAKQQSQPVTSFGPPVRSGGRASSASRASGLSGRASSGERNSQPSQAERKRPGTRPVSAAERRRPSSAAGKAPAGSGSSRRRRTPVSRSSRTEGASSFGRSRPRERKSAAPSQAQAAAKSRAARAA